MGVDFAAVIPAVLERVNISPLASSPFFIISRVYFFITTFPETKELLDVISFSETSTIFILQSESRCESSFKLFFFNSFMAFTANLSAISLYLFPE